jgi:hypothetical protein
MVEQRSNVEGGIAEEIASWPPERRVTSLEAPLAKVCIDRTIRNLEFVGFDAKLMAYASSMAHLSANAAAPAAPNLYQPILGAIPSLSVADLEAPVPRQVTANAVLAFALVAVLARAHDKYDGLLNLLRSSFAESAPLSTIAAQLSEQSSPGSEASDIVARLLAQLRARRDDLDPDDVFVVQCQLLDWLRRHEFKDILAPPFLAWMREAWARIAEQQRFRLRNPNATVPPILAAFETDGTAVQIIATALLAAEHAVESNLHPEMRAIIEGLAT